jgi:hypothetical protein
MHSPYKNTAASVGCVTCRHTHIHLHTPPRFPGIPPCTSRSSVCSLCTEHPTDSPSPPAERLPFCESSNTKTSSKCNVFFSIISHTRFVSLQGDAPAYIARHTSRCCTYPQLCTQVGWGWLFPKEYSRLFSPPAVTKLWKDRCNKTVLCLNL